MPNRNVPHATLSARLKALLHRHRDLDDRIDSEQARPRHDALGLKVLKLERLRLRDSIRSLRSTLMDAGMNPPSLN